MEENNSSQDNQEKEATNEVVTEIAKTAPDEEKATNEIVNEVISDTAIEQEKIQPSDEKKEKTQKVVKNSTAITLTIIEIITTLFACGICLFLTFSTMAGNHAWSIILYFAFFAIILGVGFIYALISNITILVLMLTGKKPKPKGVIISYIINCLTIFLYVPTIVIMVLAIQQVII